MFTQVYATLHLIFQQQASDFSVNSQSTSAVVSNSVASYLPGISQALQQIPESYLPQVVGNVLRVIGNAHTAIVQHDIDEVIRLEPSSDKMTDEMFAAMTSVEDQERASGLLFYRLHKLCQLI